METIDNLIMQAKDDGIQRFIVGAYVLHGGKLLLLKRSATEDFLPNIVELPSGGVDEGENLEDALEREVMEETGLKIVSIDRYVNSFDYLSGSGKKARQLNFSVIVQGADKIVLNPQEHDTYFWVELRSDALQQLNMTQETNATILDAIVKLGGVN